MIEHAEHLFLNYYCFEWIRPWECELQHYLSVACEFYSGLEPYDSNWIWVRPWEREFRKIISTVCEIYIIYYLFVHALGWILWCLNIRNFFAIIYGWFYFCRYVVREQTCSFYYLKDWNWFPESSMYVWSLPQFLVVWMFDYVCRTQHEGYAQFVATRTRGQKEE